MDLDDKTQTSGRKLMTHQSGGSPCGSFKPDDSESDADNNILTSGSDTATGTNATAGAFTNLRYLKWYNVAGGSTDEATRSD